MLTFRRELLRCTTEAGHVLAVNSDNGDILWQSKVASDNLYGIVVHEDNIDPRCVSSSLHMMDEEVLLTRLMDGFDDIESLDDDEEDEEVSEEDEEEIDADDNIHEEL
ncbi:Oidioi.mRNA.OKI2018_I69.XSR.g15981.t1.cds [Oikopleura dioica]|uniref:Oidioi.mRNA.OKI2018_I69.XSR.g15981.t1.cds n=1 Tax=Oikopleura dioica TaxID=34765 RepID=A0ABN7SIU5_OIKDI|nr:Oidioi.mRNA.OKI2018_I69.XSR.g15981.t1.cds [Oikopleura dioica]